MPQQMRGFWVCDFCNAPFDRPEEAEYHEGLCRQTLSRQPQRKSLEQQVQQPLDQQMSQPGYHYETAATGSHQDHSYLHAAARQPSPQHASSMESQQAVKSPRRSPPPLQSNQQEYISTTLEAATMEASDSRRYLLLDAKDASQQQHFLESSDALSCQNLQLFELSVDEAEAHDDALKSSEEHGASRVGLICRRCASLGARLSDSELSMPRSIASVIDAVYSMADRHLQSCELLPSSERRTIQEAVRMRQQRAVSAETGGASAWQKHDEEVEARQREILVEYLKQRCFQLGIVNRYPENSGICFAETAEAAASHSASPQHHAAADSAHHRASPPQCEAIATVASAGHQYPADGSLTLAAAAAAAATGQPTYSAPPSVIRSPALAPQSMQLPFAPPSYLSPTALAMRHATAATVDPHQSNVTAAVLYHQQVVAAAAASGPAPYELPADFPFFQDPYEGDWLCKYCSHVHPQYRDVNFRWSMPERTPPPGDFIDAHLSVCRAYLEQQQQMAEYYQQQQSLGTIAEPHSPYTYGHGPPPDVATYSPATAAAGFGQARVNPEISPLTPNTAAYANAYDGAMPAGGMHHQDAGANYTQEALTQRLPPARPASPAKMGPSGRKAIAFLAEQDVFAHTPDEQNLVRFEDKLLLTDYLYYLMKQLQVVRFSEGDRKTRGGKRENILLGFGGLQCIHCAETSKSRKFYWSGVDRLSNSFAEIPTHILKCKECPDEIKDALTTLKEIHQDQMSRLPRGSQKVFFRRVWKRIHDADPPSTPTDDGSPRLSGGVSGHQVSPAEDTKQTSPSGTTSGTSTGEDSPYLMQRPTKEAAKVLAESVLHADNVQLSPSSRVLLAIAEDPEFLSPQDCLIRRQLEVFCATWDDVRAAADDTKFPIVEGQVGLRCKHCSTALHGTGARGNAVTFPYSIHGIYEAVREFQRAHLSNCQNFPSSLKAKLDNMNESSTISSIQRKYYALAAKGLGLKDSSEGIRAGSESVPVVSQAVFNFSDVDLSDGWRDEQQIYDSNLSGSSSSKRKHDGYGDDDELPEGRKPHLDQSTV
ncbi:hypothetical protein MPSEU_000634000 [Mayamaea pseudoterrestris]|nr:hypothetical protein MPSEU_000634000 [Mayamaea pseudoterrestris]